MNNFKSDLKAENFHLSVSCAGTPKHIFPADCISLKYPHTSTQRHKELGIILPPGHAAAVGSFPCPLRFTQLLSHGELKPCLWSKASVPDLAKLSFSSHKRSIVDLTLG